MKQKYILGAISLFVLPLVLATTIVSLFEGSIPNAISSPLALKTFLLPELFASNITQTLKLILFDSHVLAITSIHQRELVWGIYWSLMDMLLLIVAAMFLSTVLMQWKLQTQKQKWLLLLLTLLSWSALFEIQLSGCCTSGPEWWLEVLFLFKAYISNPYLDTINWQGLYQKLSSVSPFLRSVIFIASLLLVRKIANGDHGTSCQ